MKRDPEAKKLIARLQAQEHREHVERLRKITRGLKGAAGHFHKDELSALEAIVERAYGRVQLARQPHDRTSKT